MKKLRKMVPRSLRKPGKKSRDHPWNRLNTRDYTPEQQAAINAPGIAEGIELARMPDLEQRKAQAEEIVERVWEKGRGTGLTEADYKFATLNRSVLILALVAKGFDPVTAYADCLKKNFDEGMSAALNEAEPAVALRNRESVISNISDLASVKKGDAGEHKAPTVQVIFAPVFGEILGGNATASVEILEPVPGPDTRP